MKAQAAKRRWGGGLGGGWVGVREGRCVKKIKAKGGNTEGR